MINSFIFQRGFRTFFFTAGLYACLGMLAWLAVLSLPSLSAFLFPQGEGLAPYEWHAHEMLFGYAAAAMAGFLLTAVPNWTGTVPPAGKPIAFAFAAWLLGRLGIWGQAFLPDWLTALADLSFMPIVAFLVGQRLLKQKEGRNKFFLVLLALFWLGQLLVHASLLGLVPVSAHQGRLLSLDSLILVIAIIGGRIVPSFTMGWLRQSGKMVNVAPRPRIDKLAVATAFLVLLFDQLPVPSQVFGFVCLAAAIVHAIRVAGWKGQLTGPSPIVWILHLGYSWVAIGFLIRGLAQLTPVIPETVSLHAHTIGAVGSMTLGVMTRASLGHSGLPIKAYPAIALSYVLISLAAIVRVFAPAAAPGFYDFELLVAGLLWASAFGIFTVLYFPILTKPRPDGIEG